MSKLINIADLKTDGLQMRAEINREAVREYAEAAKGGAVFPPVTVFWDGGKSYWLADGFHRVEAAKLLGKRSVRADVRNGTWLDALKYALLANAIHGIRRTNDDKRKAVATVWERRVELGLGDNPSDRAVAEKAGVSENFAGSQVRTMRTCGKPRTGLDGKNYPPMPTRRPEANCVNHAVDAPQQKQEDRCVNYAPDATPPQLPTVPMPKRKYQVLDRFGNEVLQEKLHTWSRLNEVDEAARAVSKLRVTLRKAQETKDPLWAGLNYGVVLPALDNLYARMSGAKPFCVCRMCQGIGCRVCGMSGFMTEEQYNRLPEERKGGK